MNDNTLDSLAVKYRTDKSSNRHGYAEIYDSFFSSIQNDHLKILEIGVHKQRSLKMWNEYFKNSLIIGVDINNLSLDVQGYSNIENVNIEQADQSNKYHLEKITKKIWKFRHNN